MITINVLYVLATGCLMTGSIMDFNHNDLPSYFFVIGSTLFFVKSLLSFCSYIIHSRYNKELTEKIYDGVF